MFDNYGETMVRAKKPRAQTGLRLEPEMLERLRNSPHGLSNEIRERIERTFREDALDPVTRELRDIVVQLADLLAIDYFGGWQSSPEAHHAFAAGLTKILADYKPPAEVGTPGASALMKPDIPPEHMGQIRADDVQRWHSHPYLEAAKGGPG